MIVNISSETITKRVYLCIIILGSLKSTNTNLPLIDYYNNQKIITSLDLNHSPQQWNCLYSNKSSVCNDCIITHNSICCERNSLDKSTYSITVEHNENF
ncbi:unnamed protein product [Rotaria magnacalcarata]|uniref:Uncharacterized protein n=1 Tax=Rotaria magnacalcarata TaxID=392030 RepID=A0A8S3I6L2_9BILA|nr:unnamed protein product [Rotaria magnacalcarata]